MAETRSQAMLKEATVREVKGTLGSRIETMEQKMEQHIAEMFEAIRMISVQKDNPSTSDHPSQQRSAPTSSPVIHHQTIDNGRGRSGSNNYYSGMTRLAKIDFPRFGGNKILEWLFKVEQFFAIDHTPDDLKVGLASIHFDDLVATWHRSIVESESDREALLDWRKYTTLLKERFEEVLDDPFAELKQLQETDGGIVDYHGKFELIRNIVKFPEEYLVSAYLAGLRNDTDTLDLYHNVYCKCTAYNCNT